MKITATFKQFLVDKHGLTAGATDEAAVKLTTEKLTKGELSAEDIVKHSVSADPKAIVNDMVKTAVAGELAPINDTLSKLTAALEGLKAAPAAPQAPVAPAAPAKTPDDVLAEAAEKAALKAIEKLGLPTGSPVSPFSVLSGKRTETKKMDEIYSASTKSAVYPTKTHCGTPHPFAGQQAWHEGAPLHEKSQLGMAVTGAWLKYMAKRDGGANILGNLSDQDKELCHYALHEMEWRGHWNAFDPNNPTAGDGIRGKLSDFQIKALADSSGAGTEVVPQVWDEAVVTIPVLYGEVYPMVDQQTLDRGRQIHAASILNPTVAGGTADESAGTSIISLQSTSNFFTQILPLVYPCVGAIQIGRDFLSDTPVNVGEILSKAFGFKTLEFLDRVILYGNVSGSANEPTGIFNASGTTGIVPTFPVNGPLMVSDAETLMYGVAKATRGAQGGRVAFFSNDTTYRRFRSIPTGTDNSQRVFGMTIGDYKLLDVPYKVQNDVPDGYVGYGNMAYYRMYRRMGMEIRTVTDGITLAQSNTQAIVVRSRWAGSVMLGSAFALMTKASNVG